MEQRKPKISIRKVLQALLTLVATTGCVAAMVSASRTESGKTLKGINVEIRNGDKYHFIDKADLMNLVVNDRHLDIMHMPLSKIDIHGMERIVSANQWVSDAQVYIDNMQVLHMSVSQRVPIVRIFEATGNSYYLDTTLSELHTSDKFVYYTSVVTNVPVLKDDSISKDLKTQIVTLVRRIEKDTFWNAQVSEIAVDSAHGFELTPVLGTHKIVLGDTARLDEKFHDLFVFYKNVLNNIGWDKYEVLDVRFKGQVVASPSLPFKSAPDKAMATMNWVKSIIGNDSTGKSSGSADSARVKKALDEKLATPSKTMVLQSTQAMLSRLQGQPAPAVNTKKPVPHTKAAALPPATRAVVPHAANPAEHKHPIGPVPDKKAAPPQAKAQPLGPPKPKVEKKPAAKIAQPKLPQAGQAVPQAKPKVEKQPTAKSEQPKPALKKADPQKEPAKKDGAAKKETAQKKEPVKKETAEKKAAPEPKAIYKGNQ